MLHVNYVSNRFDKISTVVCFCTVRNAPCSHVKSSILIYSLGQSFSKHVWQLPLKEPADNWKILLGNLECSLNHFQSSRLTTDEFFFKVTLFQCSPKTQIILSLQQTSGYLFPWLLTSFSNTAKLKVKFRAHASSPKVCHANVKWKRLFMILKKKKTNNRQKQINYWHYEYIAQRLSLNLPWSKQMTKIKWLSATFSLNFTSSQRVKQRKIPSSPLPLTSLSTSAFNFLLHNYRIYKPEIKCKVSVLEMIIKELEKTSIMINKSFPYLYSFRSM